MSEVYDIVSLRQYLVFEFGADSEKVKALDALFKNINALKLDLKYANEELRRMKGADFRSLKHSVMDIIDKTYDKDKDPYGVHRKLVYAIKNKIDGL